MRRKSKSTASRKHVLRTVRDLERVMQFMDSFYSPLKVISSGEDEKELFWWKQGYKFALGKLREIA